MELNEKYYLSEIEGFCLENHLEITEYGTTIKGSNFILCESDFSTYSFVLTDLDTKGFIYKCVFIS